MFYLYILRIKKTGRYYVGQTQNLAERQSSMLEPKKKLNSVKWRWNT